MLITQILAPNRWLTVSLFLAIATLFNIGIGWLIQTRKLPLSPVIPSDQTLQQFINIWVKLALLIGLILPAIMLAVFWQQPQIRQFFGCYLLVLIVQLASEFSFRRWLCESIVVVIGTVYTIFRIWQMWFGLNLTTYPQPWYGLFWLILVFWLANLILDLFVLVKIISFDNVTKDSLDAG